MRKIEKQNLLAIPLILSIGAGIAWAGSQNSVEAFGWPLFMLCGGLSLAINWLAVR